MKWLGAALVAGAVATSLAAQVPDPNGAAARPPIVTLAPRLDVGPSAGGGILRLTATLASGWHVNSHKPSEEYLIATVAHLDAQPGVTFGEPAYPEGVAKKFSFSETALSVYETSFTIQVPVLWGANKPPSAISGKLDYQACNDKSCLAPASVAFRAEGPALLSAAGAAPAASGVRAPNAAVSLTRAGAAGSTAAAGASRDFGDMLDRHGMFLVLLSIFVGGLALNLTPCVYPVIPLTVGYFGNQAAGSSRRRFGLAGLYVLGMATMYSVLGVVAALSGRLFGATLQNPWVLGAIAAALVAMALSMFGVWEIRMPTTLMNRAGARAGAAGAFGMGLFVGVVAAPCVGGFIVGLLAFVAARQDPYLGFLFFFTLSLGLRHDAEFNTMNNKYTVPWASDPVLQCVNTRVCAGTSPTPCAPIRRCGCGAGPSPSRRSHGRSPSS